MGLRKSSKNASTSKFAKKVKNRPTLLYVCTMFSCGRVGGRGVFFNKPVHRFSTEGNFCFHSPLFNLKYLLFKKTNHACKKVFHLEKDICIFFKTKFFSRKSALHFLVPIFRTAIEAQLLGARVVLVGELTARHENIPLNRCDLTNFFVISITLSQQVPVLSSKPALFISQQLFRLLVLSSSLLPSSGHA